MEALKSGQTVSGIRLNRDDLSIQLHDTRGNLRSFLMDNVQDVRYDKPSLTLSSQGLPVTYERPLHTEKFEMTNLSWTDGIVYVTRPENAIYALDVVIGRQFLVVRASQPAANVQRLGTAISYLADGKQFVSIPAGMLL